MKKKTILYCGDDTLGKAARYLYTVLKNLGYSTKHVSSRQKLKESDFSFNPDLLILSDYPASNISNILQKKILRHVKKGMGLLMIGGYGSFHGKDGFYHRTSIQDALPVEISPKDDRVNHCQGVLIRLNQFSFAGNLDFSRCPVFLGFNKVTPKKKSSVLLTAVPLIIEGRKIFTASEEFPLFVTSEYGSGKTGAFMTDFAPHWCGGLVDWGKQRVFLPAPFGKTLEISSDYIQLIKQVISRLI